MLLINVSLLQCIFDEIWNEMLHFGFHNLPEIFRTSHFYHRIIQNKIKEKQMKDDK